MTRRLRSSMYIAGAPHIVDYRLCKPPVRNEERNCFLLRVFQTGFMAGLITGCLGLSLPDVFPVKHWLIRERIALHG
ncbi:hypothetical protein Tco_1444305 [Tanacetum coccineum]